MLLPSVYACGIAWTWGVVTGALLRVLRSGQTQIAFGRPNDNWLHLVFVITAGLNGRVSTGLRISDQQPDDSHPFG